MKRNLLVNSLLLTVILWFSGCFLPPPMEAEIGPSGGYVFYDKGYYGDGWRYLEAAPIGWYISTFDDLSILGYFRANSNSDNIIVGTGTAIGAGKANTEALISAYGSTTYSYPFGSTKESSYAAKVCSELYIYHDGIVFDDWFLPSLDELIEMKKYFLEDNSLNFYGFSTGCEYLSSSEGSSDLCWCHVFTHDYELTVLSNRNELQYFRPIRAF